MAQIARRSGQVGASVAQTAPRCECGRSLRIRQPAGSIVPSRLERRKRRRVPSIAQDIGGRSVPVTTVPSRRRKMLFLRKTIFTVLVVDTWEVLSMDVFNISRGHDLRFLHSLIFPKKSTGVST